MRCPLSAPVAIAFEFATALLGCRSSSLAKMPTTSLLLLAPCGKSKSYQYIFFFVLLFMGPVSCVVKKSLTNLMTNQACQLVYDSLYSHVSPSKPIPKNFQDFQDLSFKDYCRDHMISNLIAGNPKAEGENTPWHQSWGAGLKIVGHNQTQYHIPYFKTVLYRTTGACQLGMRIYLENLEDLSSTQLKPFMFIHGGAWIERRFTSTTAVETFVPYLTSKGYVVFSPFYRLLRDHGGPKECANAKGSDILDDINQAFLWVQTHSEEYGAKKNQLIAVGGHSAGGHLATYLITEHPKEVSRGVLLYPLTDFGYMLSQTKSGEFDYLEKNEVMGYFVYGEGKPMTLINDKLDIIARNSFPDLIRKAPQNYPPVYMIHGSRDALVPVANSQRLCDAYNLGMNPKVETLAYRKRSSCGPKGYFVNITNGRHMLDIRCIGDSLKAVIPEQFASSLLCPSGGQEDAGEVARAVEDIRNNFLE